MWLMLILSWIAIVIQIMFLITSIAAGLYYLAELIEEYTQITAKIIKYLIITELIIHILLLLFEDLPIIMIISGIISQLIHFLILQSFPYFELSSITFISGLILLIINHYFAFNYFSSTFLPFSQVLGYFTLCLWIVPFSFFVSLSANDNVLPTINQTNESFPLISNQQDADLVSNYFSRKSSRKVGLLSFFNYAKESYLPFRLSNKKPY